MAKTLEKAQVAVAALETRLAAEEAAKAKVASKLADLKAAWGELAEGDNSDKAMAANEGQQAKAESQIKRASGRIESLRARLGRAKAELPAAQFEADVAELGRLEEKSRLIYALYRKQATELVALAGVLDDLERQAGTVGMRARANADGRPCPRPNLRRGFETGGGTWWTQYGQGQALAKYLSWLRKCERVLGWD